MYKHLSFSLKKYVGMKSHIIEKKKKEIARKKDKNFMRRKYKLVIIIYFDAKC